MVRRGEYGEILARRYLEEEGVRVLETNFRFHHGEIDIIAEEGGGAHLLRSQDTLLRIVRHTRTRRDRAKTATDPEKSPRRTWRCAKSTTGSAGSMLSPSAWTRALRRYTTSVMPSADSCVSDKFLQLSSSLPCATDVR